MKPAYKTEIRDNNYHSGKFKVAIIGNGKIDCFVGIEDNTVLPYDKTGKNYKRIVYTDVFEFEDVDNGISETIDGFENAVERYLDAVSDHKVLRQLRVLVNGCEDKTVIAYRWI